MTKIQFGSGCNILDGWLNLQEGQADITKPLAFKNYSVDYILAEHVCEHVSHQGAFGFFKECYRILRPTGVVRIIVPDVVKIWSQPTEDYLQYISGNASEWWSNAGLKWHGRNATAKDAVETIVYCHGHKSCWNEAILMTLLGAVGFRVHLCQYGKSHNSTELNNVDGHWKMMGLERCIMESSVAEGTK